MARIPATLQGYSVFLDGEGYAGRIVRGTPPRLTKTLLQHRAGMPMPVDLFAGLENMRCAFVLAEYHSFIANQMRKTDMTGRSR